MNVGFIFATGCGKNFLDRERYDENQSDSRSDEIKHLVGAHGHAPLQGVPDLTENCFIGASIYAQRC
jgi:hypothetical protein